MALVDAQVRKALLGTVDELRNFFEVEGFDFERVGVNRAPRFLQRMAGLDDVTGGELHVVALFVVLEHEEDAQSWYNGLLEVGSPPESPSP